MIPKKGGSATTGGRVTLQNLLPAGHPQRMSLENAIRQALEGLDGPWDVVLEEPKGLSLVIAVVAPDGSSWTMRCNNPSNRDPESIGAIVRTACDRRRAARGRAKGSGGHHA